MPLLSVMIMAGSNNCATLDGVRRIVQRVVQEQKAVGNEIEILVALLSGFRFSDVDQRLSEATVLECCGMNTAEARNVALQKAKGEIICFIDADCLPAEGWLSAIVSPFENKDVVGVKGTHATNDDRPLAQFEQLESAERFRRLRNQTAIDFVDMYSAAFRRDVLVANRGFDDRFDRLEDQELSYRLVRRGYTLAFAEDAKVIRSRRFGVVEYAKNKAVTGYWKAQVIRLFPDLSISDSYTPQALKFQIAALSFAVTLLVLTVVWQWSFLFFLAALLFFFASSLPFLAFVWHRNRAVFVIALPMLAIRALSLAAGYAYGVLRPPPKLVPDKGQFAGTTYLLKRLLDIFGSFLGLAVTVILAPFIFTIIKLNSPGPVLFRQIRIGRGGRPFTLYKFRTMERDAETNLDKWIDIQDLDQPAFKMADDPRVTSAGRFLRRWSLDELPQFWNVLRGDMSLVGPRPEEERIVALYSDWHRQRLSVKPGMTGPMQVQGRGNLSLDERVKLELDYIDKYSLWCDIGILLETIPCVLSGEGAR